MSTKQKRISKKKSEDELPVQPTEVPIEVVKQQPVHLPKGRGNQNEVVKSRLEAIIDMLTIEADEDEKILRKNVMIALKHIREISQLL